MAPGMEIRELHRETAVPPIRCITAPALAIETSLSTSVRALGQAMDDGQGWAVGWTAMEIIKTLTQAAGVRPSDRRLASHVS